MIAATLRRPAAPHPPPGGGCSRSAQGDGASIRAGSAPLAIVACQRYAPNAAPSYCAASGAGSAAPPCRTCAALRAFALRHWVAALLAVAARNVPFLALRGLGRYAPCRPCAKPSVSLPAPPLARGHPILGRADSFGAALAVRRLWLLISSPFRLETSP